MKKPTKRKNTLEKPRARRDSARLFDDASKTKAPKAPKTKAQGGIEGQKGIFSRRTRTRIVFGLVIILVLGGIGGIVDYAINRDKIHSGVWIGSVDLSGKTVEEARRLLEANYTHRMMGTSVDIYATAEASSNPEESLRITEEAKRNPYLSPEELRANTLVWQVSTASLLATLDTISLVQEAYACGREDGGLFKRLKTFFNGYVIEPRAHYNEGALEALAAEIDLCIGSPRVNYGISIFEGKATITPGHDGYMLDRKEFIRSLDRAFFHFEGGRPSFVANAIYTPLQITQEIAQESCERINNNISHGALFLCDGLYWIANENDLGTWIETRIEPDGDSWELRPYFNYARAKSMFIAHLQPDYDGKEVIISFTLEGGRPIVNLETAGTVPLSEEAVEALSDYLFTKGAYISAQPTVTVASTALPKKLSFQEAIDLRIIECISEFTTEYTSYATARNHNIHLAAELLNNSIIKANGGTWSFHGTAGNCNEEAGFQGAGSIIDGEFVDEIGGGICQVGTTVFNAVYDAGFKILQRHNHSIYLANYPAGRDAAVSWPDLDLRWQNDSSSDVLLVMSYTDTTLTAAIFGINPGYQVTTVVGDWYNIEKHKVKTFVDESVAEGKAEIRVYGQDGGTISVRRTVTDKDNVVLITDNFVSKYIPKEELKALGPNTPEDTEDEKEKPPGTSFTTP